MGKWGVLWENVSLEWNNLGFNTKREWFQWESLGFNMFYIMENYGFNWEM